AKKKRGARNRKFRAPDPHRIMTKFRTPFPIKRICILAAMSLASLLAAFAAGNFTIESDHFLLEGKPFVIRSGEMHYARVPREYWQHRLRMARAMGLNKKGKGVSPAQPQICRLTE